MSDRPFHHGNLRAELLEHASRTLREGGVDDLSLRELARRAGVSHAAPRRHFPDRQALLDALAEQGFHRLTEAVRDLRARAGGDDVRVFRDVARGFVDFAVDDAALMELMFTAKNGEPPPGLQRASGEFFALMADVVARATPASGAPLPSPERLQLLLVATLQGVATLVATGRVRREQVDDLLDDTYLLFSGTGDRALPSR